MNPANLLAVFEIDPAEKGARMWQGLVWRRWAGQKTRDIMADFCRVEGCTLRMAYGCMKRAMRPVFEADAEMLDQLGLARPNTVVELADAVVATIPGTVFGRVRELMRERERERGDSFLGLFKTLDMIPEEDPDEEESGGENPGK